MNNFVLVGRIAQDPEIKELENKKMAVVTLAVSRNFKNADGEYETDFIPVILWEGVAERTCEWCHKGDVIGVKGRIQSHTMANDSFIELIGERVSFLSSRKAEK